MTCQFGERDTQWQWGSTTSCIIRHSQNKSMTGNPSNVILQNNLKIMQIWATKHLEVKITPRQSKTGGGSTTTSKNTAAATLECELWTWTEVRLSEKSAKRTKRPNQHIQCYFSSGKKMVNLRMIQRRNPSYKAHNGTWKPLSTLLRPSFLNGSTPIVMKKPTASSNDRRVLQCHQKPPLTLFANPFLRSLQNLTNHPSTQQCNTAMVAAPRDKSNQNVVGNQYDKMIRMTHKPMELQRQLRDLLRDTKEEHSSLLHQNPSKNERIYFSNVARILGFDFADVFDDSSEGEGCGAYRKIAYCAPPHMPDTILRMRSSCTKNDKTFTGLRRRAKISSDVNAPPTESGMTLHEARECARQYVNTFRSKFIRSGKNPRYVVWPPIK